VPVISIEVVPWVVSEPVPCRSTRAPWARKAPLTSTLLLPAKRLLSSVSAVKVVGAGDCSDSVELVAVSVAGSCRPPRPADREVEPPVKVGVARVSVSAADSDALPPVTVREGTVSVPVAVTASAPPLTTKGSVDAVPTVASDRLPPLTRSRLPPVGLASADSSRVPRAKSISVPAASV
jgi:hypothetical protein